jgi:biopolymer transport protein ExbB
MSDLVELVRRGGPVMAAILLLSVVLYSRCFRLLLQLRRSRRQLEDPDALALRPRLRYLGDEMQESFRQQRMALGAMIAAAPLLGLLGTVSGMSATFESLSGHAQDQAMTGLAHGISEVLVATESGLVVAIPALVVVHLAQRLLRQCLRQVSRLEEAA